MALKKKLHLNSNRVQGTIPTIFEPQTWTDQKNLTQNARLINQTMEDHSNSTTASATSPPHDRCPEEEGGMLWKALSQNGHCQGPPLTGEASQLLRKLITCRKLGMSITPAPPHPASLLDGPNFIKNEIMHDIRVCTYYYLNQAWFCVCECSHVQTSCMYGKERVQEFGGLFGLQSEVGNAKSGGRRKQSYPSKAALQEEGMTMDQTAVVSPCPDGGDVEMDYLPDFTGNNPWCNLSLVKTKVRLVLVSFVLKKNCISEVFFGKVKIVDNFFCF